MNVYRIKVFHSILKTTWLLFTGKAVKKSAKGDAVVKRASGRSKPEAKYVEPEVEAEEDDEDDKEEDEEEEEDAEEEDGESPPEAKVREKQWGFFQN